MLVFNWRAEEYLVVNNKAIERLSRNYRSDSWPLKI